MTENASGIYKVTLEEISDPNTEEEKKALGVVGNGSEGASGGE